MALRRGATEHTGMARAILPLLREAEEGSGSCLIVERGEGDASLLDVATTEALRRGFSVRTVLGSPTASGSDDALRALLDVDADAARALGIDGRPLDLDALRALARRVDQLCVDAPLLLVVDHADLLDAASARFLSYLAKNLDARSVSLLLLAVHVAGGSWLDELGTALGRHPHVVRSGERGPDGKEVQTLLEALDEEQRAAVEALAVLGPSPSVAAVAAVAEVPADTVLQALDELFARGLLRRTSTGAGQLVVATAVLDAMSPTRRSELHGRAAVHARSVGGAAEQVAAHLEHTVPGAHAWAGDVLRTAAARALAAGDARRAVGWLQRAIEEQRDGCAEVPLGILLELSRAQLRAGDPGATASLRLAIARTTGRERRKLQLRLARHLSESGLAEEAVAEIEAVLADIDPSDPEEARALVEARTALAAACRLSLALRHRSADLLDQLVPDPDEPLADDPSLLAELAYEHALAGTDRQVVIDLSRRAMAATAGRAHPPMASHALFVALLAAEALEDARLLCDRIHGDARRHPVEAHRRGSLALAEGDLHRAVAWSRMAVADIEWVAPLFVPGARAQLARALVRLGDLDAAAVALQLPGGKGRWRQNVTYHPVLLAQAELAAAAGDWWRAALFAEDCAEFSRRMGTHNPAMVPWQPVAVQALAQLGRTDEAVAILTEATERAQVFGAPTVLGRLAELRRSIQEPSADQAEPSTAATIAVVRDDTSRAPGSPCLRLLGEAVLVIDGEEHRLGDDLVDRAVCIVALEARGVHDEQLAEALWPEGDPAVGRTRLRNVLTRIRQRYGEVVVRSGRSVHLADDIAVDLRTFERLATEALSASDDSVAERLGHEALGLHRGELCPAHPFEAWAAAPRTGVRQRWLALLDRLADLAARRGDVSTSMAMFEQAIAAEPWDEDRYLDAVERLVAAGRPAAARSLLERSATMCEDLGVPPSARHAALQEALGAHRR